MMETVTQPTPTVKPKPSDKKWLLWGLIGFTAILLLTAVVLFIQLKKPAGPLPTPKPKPAASPTLPGIEEVAEEGVCELSFTVSASPSPSPSPSPEPISCFDTCSTDSECDDDQLRCMDVSGTKRCVNPDCSEDADCSCEEEKKECWDKCQIDNDCSSSLRCMTIPGTNDKRCVNPSCVTESDCSCAASPSPSPLASPSPVVQTKGGQPVLPEAGVSGPAVLGVSAGLLLILGAVLLF